MDVYLAIVLNRNVEKCIFLPGFVNSHGDSIDEMKNDWESIIIRRKWQDVCKV